MTRILATAAAMAAFVGIAWAAETEGTVKAVDPTTRTITLDDGQSYVAQSGIEIASLAAGAKVKITYDEGTMTVTEIEAM